MSNLILLKTELYNFEKKQHIIRIIECQVKILKYFNRNILIEKCFESIHALYEVEPSCILSSNKCGTEF